VVVDVEIRVHMDLSLIENIYFQNSA